MYPIPFKEQNMLLGAGGIENTVDMPVTLALSPDKAFFVVSCWKPTEEEIENIIKTKEIWIGTMGTPPPPVTVMAFNPFKHYGYYPMTIEEIIAFRRQQENEQNNEEGI